METITEQKTNVFKSFHGWQAKTIRTEKGQTFEICTMKRHSGNITTSVTKIEARQNNEVVITSFGMNDGYMSINHGKFNATEKSVKNAHFEGLAKFDEKIQNTPIQEIKKEVPEVGDILFLDGYGKSKGSNGNNWIIYDIKNDQWGLRYLCVEKDTLLLQSKDYVKPFSKKFGIGMYFEKGYDMAFFGIDQNILSNMLIEAQNVKKQAEIDQKIASDKAKIEAEKKEKYLSQFVKADRKKTTSIIKSYCLKTFGVQKIEVSTDVFSGGDSMNVKYYHSEKNEQLEKFIDSFQEGHFNGMEDIYEYYDKSEIIIEGHILQTYKYVFCTFSYVEKLPEIEDKKVEYIDFRKELLSVSLKNNVQIIDYSEKSFVVIGETKPLKEDLKYLGGCFNFRLTYGAGWIFPMSKKEKVLSFLKD